MTPKTKYNIVARMNIQGKNVLITGAARRVGRGIALALGSMGANIAIHYNRSKKEALALLKELEQRGVRAVTVKADVRKPKKIAKVVEAASKELGGLDVLINNAAVFHPTPVDEISEDDWNKFLDINLKAYFYFAREFAKRTNRLPAKIINMADSYALSPAPLFLPYGVSKAGVIALTKGLAKTYAPDIHVNSICPGPILPPEMAGEETHKRAIGATLLKREAKIEEITKTVVFLLENDYVTGQSIYVDGGRSA